MLKKCKFCGKEYKTYEKTSVFCSRECFEKSADLTGKRFGLLTVLRKEHSRKGKSYWLCQCDCGGQKIVEGYRLRSGRTKSCYCLHQKAITKHNKCHTKLYGIWSSMKGRCLNLNDKAYKNYGGRGITICDEWKNNFQAFYDWAIKNGYKSNLSIDRINNNGNYEPTNCRWTSWVIQANNKRRNHNIEYKGEKHTIAEWSRILGLSYPCLTHRIERGWSLERALKKAT